MAAKCIQVNNQKNNCMLTGFDLSLHSQKIKPLSTRLCRPNGGMVDTKDLKSFGHCGCAGSSPASGTEIVDNRLIVNYFCIQNIKLRSPNHRL